MRSARRARWTTRGALASPRSARTTPSAARTPGTGAASPTSPIGDYGCLPRATALDVSRVALLAARPPRPRARRPCPAPQAAPPARPAASSRPPPPPRTRSSPPRAPRAPSRSAPRGPRAPISSSLVPAACASDDASAGSSGWTALASVTIWLHDGTEPVLQRITVRLETPSISPSCAWVIPSFSWAVSTSGATRSSWERGMGNPRLSPGETSRRATRHEESHDARDESPLEVLVSPSTADGATHQRTGRAHGRDGVTLLRRGPSHPRGSVTPHDDEVTDARLARGKSLGYAFPSRAHHAHVEVPPHRGRDAVEL